MHSVIVVTDYSSLKLINLINHVWSDLLTLWRAAFLGYQFPPGLI